MNAKRRKELAKVVEHMAQVRAELEAILEQEQDAYDNLPESIQDSMRGDEMEDIVETMETIAQELEDSENELTEIVEQ